MTERPECNIHISHKKHATGKALTLCSRSICPCAAAGSCAPFSLAGPFNGGAEDACCSVFCVSGWLFGIGAASPGWTAAA